MLNLYSLLRGEFYLKISAAALFFRENQANYEIDPFEAGAG